jgi:hypothetical protein
MTGDAPPVRPLCVVGRDEQFTPIPTSGPTRPSRCSRASMRRVPFSRRWDEQVHPDSVSGLARPSIVVSAPMPSPTDRRPPDAPPSPSATIRVNLRLLAEPPVPVPWPFPPVVGSDEQFTPIPTSGPTRPSAPTCRRFVVFVPPAVSRKTMLREPSQTRIFIAE